MDKRKKDKPKKKPSVVQWILLGSLVPAVFLAAYLFGAFDHDEFIPIDEVYVVDDDTLLVAGVSGQDSDVDNRRHSRLALLELDGTMHDVVRQKGPLEVLGVSDSLVWLEDAEHGIHARTLPDLGLIEGIGAAVEEHPVLSNRLQPHAFTDDTLIVTGADNRKYAIARDGSIEKLAKDADDAEWTPKQQRRATGPRSMSFEDYRAFSARVEQRDELTTPAPAPGQRTPGPLRLPDPDSVLMKSFEFVKGGQSQALHRVSLDGKLVWSATAEQLMGAFELEDQGILIEWVGIRGGNVVVLVQLSEYSIGYEGEDYTQHVQQIVDIDAKTGQVLASHPVTMPK